MDILAAYREVGSYRGRAGLESAASGSRSLAQTMTRQAVGRQQHEIAAEGHAGRPTWSTGREPVSASDRLG